MPQTSRFYFDRHALKEVAATRGDAYRAARPFPHTVIDDFLPDYVLDEVLAEFPTPGQGKWWEWDNQHERKTATQDEEMFGPATRHLFAQLNSATFVDFLRDLTGIEGLVPDPHLHGGGLHQIPSGGFLALHADFNKHPLTHLARRLNLLLYLNRGWTEEWGGALELWDRDVSACQQRILPLFNRCVVFNTTDFAFHGHPTPLLCPEGVTRKSLALYYWSKDRPTDEIAGDAWSTRFASDDSVASKRPSAVRKWAYLLLPPIAADPLRRLQRRAGRK